MSNKKEIAAQLRGSIEQDLQIMFRQFLEKARMEEIRVMVEIMSEWVKPHDFPDEPRPPEDEIPILSAFVARIDGSRFVQVGEYEVRAVKQFIKQLRELQAAAYRRGMAGDKPEASWDEALRRGDQKLRDAIRELESAGSGAPA